METATRRKMNKMYLCEIWIHRRGTQKIRSSFKSSSPRLVARRLKPEPPGSLHPLTLSLTEAATVFVELGKQYKVGFPPHLFEEEILLDYKR